MARDWRVTSEDGKLVYTLKPGDSLGTLEVKKVPNRSGSGETWYAFHEGIQLAGWDDVQIAIDYCNGLADKLS